MYKSQAVLCLTGLRYCTTTKSSQSPVPEDRLQGDLRAGVIMKQERKNEIRELNSIILGKASTKSKVADELGYNAAGYIVELLHEVGVLEQALSEVHSVATKVDAGKKTGKNVGTLSSFIKAARKELESEDEVAKS